MRKWVRVPERGDRPSRACRGRGGSHIGGLGRVIYCVQSYTSSTVAPTPLASRARLAVLAGATYHIGERTVPAHTWSHERHWWHHEVRLDRHWPHVVGGCIRSAPELSRRPPACRCSSRRCDEGRCRRCRPFDSCAPRMVGGAQQSTLRPLDRAAANLAAAGTMESCAMILRAVHPWGLARPSKLSVPGELLAAVRQGGWLMRPTLACDQWLCWQHRGHHRRCRAQRAC